MTKTEKTNLLRVINLHELKVGDNYFTSVNQIVNFINSIPIEEEPKTKVNELYSIYDSTTDEMIWNARGSAYKEYEDVFKKITSLRKSNPTHSYSIKTFVLDDLIEKYDIIDDNGNVIGHGTEVVYPYGKSNEYGDYDYSEAFDEDEDWVEECVQDPEKCEYCESLSCSGCLIDDSEE